MKRPLSRRRRIAAVCASSAAILASSPILLNGRHSSSPSTAHEFTIGVISGLAACLLGCSIVFLVGGRGECAGKGQTLGR